MKLETCNMHTLESHKEDNAKYLTHQQKAAVKEAVLLSPMTGPKSLRRNIQQLSPQKHIGPGLMRSVRRILPEQ